MKERNIYFLVVGNQKLGTGHIYRSIIYRNEFTRLGFNCQTYFLKKDKLVNEIYSSKKLSSIQIDSFKDISIINSLNNIFILDILDTSKDFIKALKKNNQVITFEDLGEGSLYADLVINALYKQDEIKTNHYYGHNYMELREEFHNLNYIANEKVKNIMITFGGTDPTNSTFKVIESIYDYCISKKININVVNGIGYQDFKTLSIFPKINIRFNIDNMAKTMMENDIVFCSAGRTIYELASIGIPSIVITHNERENSHLFATQEYGFINLGLSKELNKKEIFKPFLLLVDDYKLRKHISNIMLENNLKEGEKRVIKLILKVINEK